MNRRITQDRCGISSAGSNERAHYIKYEPVGMKERVIKVQSLQRDPLNPPQFRLKKVVNLNFRSIHPLNILCKDPGESKVSAEPLTQSPPRQVLVEDREAWKIPPTVSNWKVRNSLQFIHILGFIKLSLRMQRVI